MPLITYLNDKMRIGSSNDDKMTCTMIGAWLTELFLHERGEQLTNAAVNELTGTKDVESSQRALLAQFLNANVNNMDAKTIMKILTSHDVGATECALYAAKSGDIGTAVNAALSVGLRDAVSSTPTTVIENYVCGCHFTFLICSFVVLNRQEPTILSGFSMTPHSNSPSLFITNTHRPCCPVLLLLPGRVSLHDTRMDLAPCDFYLP